MPRAARSAVPTPDLLSPAIFAASPELTAGFTLRSFAPPELTRKAVRDRLGERTRFDRVASVGQVHGADVATVREGGHVEDHDGVVTATRGVLLTVVAADCALVLLADPDAGVVGACHSGWRGTVAGVTRHTIRAMEAEGARAERLLTWLAPCISAEAFEVGEEVAAQFRPEVVHRRPEWLRPHIDLRAELRAQLAEAGVTPGRIGVAAGCTLREPDRFYSYRAEGGTQGRMIGFIGLRPES